MKSWITADQQEIYRIKTLKSNAYIIKADNKFLLVDTGVKYSFRKLLKAMDTLGITDKNLIALILTHTHYDHVGNVHKIKEIYDTNIIVHEREGAFIEEVKKHIIITDTFDLRPLGFNGYILHTPGHTIGSISIILNNEYAIVGDTMFGVIKGSLLPPYAIDVEMLMESWKKLLDTGCRIFLTGHGLVNTYQCVKRTYERIIRKIQQQQQHQLQA